MRCVRTCYSAVPIVDLYSRLSEQGGKRYFGEEDILFSTRVGYGTKTDWEKSYSLLKGLEIRSFSYKC